MTKSCGVVALSGDGNAELAWSETTTVGEGSGWDVTIISTPQPEDSTVQEEQATDAIVDVDATTNAAEIPPEGGIETTAGADPETTVKPNELEPEPETTVGPKEEQSTSSPSERESTAGPSGEPTSSGPSVEQSSISPSEEQSPPSPSEQPSTSGPSEQPSTSGPSEEQPTTTEAEPIITTIAPTPPEPLVFKCQAAGAFAHISGDCQRFHNCVSNVPTDELKAYDMACPPLLAFSPTYGRCVRDVASCVNDAFACQSPGSFAAGDDSYYYNCVVSLRGGYHKYIVRCSPGQRFEPLLGRCWRYDWTQFQPGQALEASDLAAIKREQKELKTAEKVLKKAEKNKEKQILKQQKLEEKLAKKAAKEKAKQEAKEQAKANKPNKPLSVESAESVEVPSIEA